MLQIRNTIMFIKGTAFMKPNTKSNKIKTNRLKSFGNDLIRDKYLIIIILPTIVYYIVFHYIPMYGLSMAFTNFSISRGILRSPWVGFRWFEQFFSSIYFFRVFKNTILLSFYSLLIGFPIPIIFALMLNEVKNTHFKKLVQSVSYLPHFISVVVVVGMMVNLLSPHYGVVNAVLKNYFDIEPINFMQQRNWFRPLYVGSGIWQNFGYSSIIYMAALSSIDTQLYDAAQVDGANRWHKIKYINLPGISPTIIILLILNAGHIMNVGFEKVLLMQQPITYEVSDVISTYVYRTGILNVRYGYATAVGVLNSTINLILLISVNYLSKRVTENSLW